MIRTMNKCKGESGPKVLLVFIDGIGIGEPDPRTNPAACFSPRVLGSLRGERESLPRSGLALSSDPTMGVAGLPQSATGQAALFTGVNTARRLGRHMSGFPTRELREIVGRHSILRALKGKGKKVAFANTYTEEYLRRICRGRNGESAGDAGTNSSFAGPGLKSVTTVMSETAGLRFRTELDLSEENGLHMDFSNRFLNSMGHEVSVRSPEEAAGILARLAERFDFCLYEFFFSDLIGHRGSLSEAVALLEELDSFLFQLVSKMDLTGTSLVVTSDHGNIEDKGSRRHTANLVPLLIWGKLQDTFASLPEPVPIDRIAPLITDFILSGD